MSELNAPGDISEEDTSLQPTKLLISLQGGKDMFAGRIKEILNGKSIMKCCDQWKPLVNTQDRLEVKGSDDHLLLIKLFLKESCARTVLFLYNWLAVIWIAF